MFGSFFDSNKSEQENTKQETVQTDNAQPQKQQKSSGFDPTSLERAAKAVKQLDKSSNIKTAMEIYKEKMKTSQTESKLKKAEMEALAMTFDVQRIEKEGEESRKTLNLLSQHDELRANYVDKLSRSRESDFLTTRRQMNDEERKKQEELIERQEAERRRTIEYEAKLRQETELTRVKAETEGKIEQERRNYDLEVDTATFKAKELRETILQAIRLTGDTVGSGISQFLSDREKMSSAVLTLTAVALGIYTAKTSTSVLGRYIEARLGQPSLVRETSRQTIKQIVANPFLALSKLLKIKKPSDPLQGVILEKNLDDRLRRISVSTAFTKKNRAPFRHLLLYGPPGTGKTLFAKGLAQYSGLEYAILTGGDVAPLGRQAVTEIHKLFDWANTSSKGLLLFIDEADAFLRKRNSEKISEDVRNALNAFLYRTGTETDKFMVVYASNQPDEFDWAVSDRIDEMVKFDLPNTHERFRMLDYYLQTYFQNSDSKKARQIVIQDIDQKDLEDIAQKTEGFSGREISKLVIAWQAAAFGNENAVFTKELLYSVYETHIEQKEKKQLWSQNDTEHFISNKHN